MKIIFHVGAGKTGTSSIQGTLLRSSDRLKGSGVFYLGLMLEFSPVKLFPWQCPSATKEFSSLSSEQAQSQVELVLRKTIEQLEKFEVHTLVWSNEWFFGQCGLLAHPLKRLESDGHDVEVVAYVRRHDDWARSAYSQWGIKHKTYEGNIISFKDYDQQRRVYFAGSIKPWDQFFAQKFTLRNFDAVDDVVSDFADIVGIDRSLLLAERANDTPGGEELLLRAVFNDRRSGEVLPVVFESLFQADQIDFKKDPVAWLTEMLPKPEDLYIVREAMRGDQAEVNMLLKARGQQELSFDEKVAQSYTVNANIIYSVLFQMIEQQAIRINKLESEMVCLRKRFSVSGA